MQIFFAARYLFKFYSGERTISLVSGSCCTVLCEICGKYFFFRGTMESYIIFSMPQNTRKKIQQKAGNEKNWIRNGELCIQKTQFQNPLYRRHLSVSLEILWFSFRLGEIQFVQIVVFLALFLVDFKKFVDDSSVFVLTGWIRQWFNR